MKLSHLAKNNLFLNSIYLLLSVSLITACGGETKNNKNETDTKMNNTFQYPETQKTDSNNTYFGVAVPDPYKWLEDDRSTETEDWVKRQNEFTFNYLNKLENRDSIKQKLQAIWNYEKLSAPFKKGAYHYFYKNTGLQNQSVLYRQKEGSEPEIFLDPNTFSKDGTTSLGGISFTEDGSLAAYSISEGGSDWRKIIIIDAETKSVIEDTLIDVKFSGISWYKNAGFYYSSYDKPKGSELSAKTDQHKLFYHKLGQKQSEDQVIFGNNAETKRRYVSGSVSKDNRFLFISAAISTTGNELYMMDLNQKNPKLITILNHFDSDSEVLENQGDKLFILTNLDAPNKRLVQVSAQNPGVENWKDLIPETQYVLSVSKGSGYFFATYMVDALSQVKQYNYDGSLVRTIALPALGTASGFSGELKDTILYFSFTNYHTPNSIYTLQPKSGKIALYWSPKIDFNIDDFVSEQVFYTSKDGTKIPMMITYKKGTPLNGENPTRLYGYGGFNISLTPTFSAANAVWLQMGGIFAVANLRGGGEYGQKWHTAGTKMQKQNVFDDFISAAHYLIDKKYTSSAYLALQGGSNGGLLVGAVMTQAPELARVALPAVGVLDMLRYHTFTAGAGWAYDYGTADDSKEMFEYLKAYSPVHNVKKGTSYPATLVTTGDHDDRVVPAHSFKFIAELQDKQSGNQPVMIRIETNAGHGAGTPVSKTIDYTADVFAFTLAHFGKENM